MWPIIASFPFLGMGFLAIVLIVAIAARGPLITRLGYGPGIGLALLLGLLPALITASLGWMAWTSTWTLTTYAICTLAASVLAAWMLVRLSRNDPRLHPLPIVDLLVAALVGGLVGARTRYVWENIARFRSDDGLAWSRILDLNSGGMVWYGGLIGGTIVVAALAWRRRLPLLPLADAIAIPLAMAVAVGRIGCFLNGCCYGRVCALPWAVTFPQHGDARHPAQLYETAAMLVLAAALLAVRRFQAPGKDGVLAGFFLLGYGIWRFFNEGLRDDYRHAGTLNDVGGTILTNSQITSLWLLAGGCVLVTWASLRPSASTAAGDGQGTSAGPGPDRS